MKIDKYENVDSNDLAYLVEPDKREEGFEDDDNGSSAKLLAVKFIEQTGNTYEIVSNEAFNLDRKTFARSIGEEVKETDKIQKRVRKIVNRTFAKVCGQDGNNLKRPSLILIADANSKKAIDQIPGK